MFIMNKKKIMLFLSIFLINSTNPIQVQDSFSLLSGILIGELYNFINKGKMEYAPEKKTPKKPYLTQIYSKIFTEGPILGIVQELYTETLLDLYKKNYLSTSLNISIHNSIFKEFFLLTTSFRKSVKKIIAGFRILFRENINKFSQQKSLYAFVLTLGSCRALLENKIKNELKIYTDQTTFGKNHNFLTSICSEMFKIGISDFILTPLIYSILGILTLSYGTEITEKQIVARAIREGINTILESICNKH